MKKSKPGIAGIHDTSNLFRGTALQRHRPLVLPRFLEEEAAKPINIGADRDAAHAVLVRWAELESTGDLDKDETSLDEPFRQEVFGKALRYLTSTTSPSAYYYEKKFYVPSAGTPDGVLGNFPPVNKDSIRVVIELKNANTDLDHDKFSGRTPVQQCWDYMNNLPDCPWGIVSNFVSFRLYHRDKTQQSFEHFELQKLRDPEEFARFYTIFERNGLLKSNVVKVPRTLALMEKTQTRQKEVGDKLYNYYSDQRIRLIQHLVANHGKTQDQALRAAQKLLDRIIFVAFCEDRGLLPHKLIDSTWKNVAPLARVTNPRWNNFLDMFHGIDKGHPALDLPTGYNGGLFAPDDNIDELNLEDAWTDVFREIGNYDFAEDVNVDVLGHLFEKSVSEIEKIRVGGAFFTTTTETPVTMPKSAERKRFGIYYTPPDFTRFIVENTIGKVIEERLAALAKEHEIDPQQSMRIPPSKAYAAYWHECINAVRRVAIVDPACGSGAFLIAAYEWLEDEYQTFVEHLAHHTGKPASTWAVQIPEMILGENLHGVDLSPEAVEITQLSLWIRSARKGRRLDDLSTNIVCGNSLVTDSAVHPRAMDWKKTFPRVFERSGGAGFHCVIGNPPWERLKLQEREFFAFSAPDVAAAVNAAERRKLVEGLKNTRPELHENYVSAKGAAERVLDFVRNRGNFPLTGRGDVNTYMVFAELAKTIVHLNGIVGLLLPSGIATDDTTKHFFNQLMDSKAIISLYDFENREGIFVDVHRGFKFTALVFGGSARKNTTADFVFFARNMRQISDRNRHVALSAKDLALLNPNTRTCPIFRNRRDADLTKSIYTRIPILIDLRRETGGNPWEVTFSRVFDQDTAAEHFRGAEWLANAGFVLKKNIWQRQKELYRPLYEAKMVQAFDHRAASVIIDGSNWMRKGQTEPTTLVEHVNPEFCPMPVYWVNDEEIQRRMKEHTEPAYLAFKKVTSATNQRTMIAAFVPYAAFVDSLPVLLFEKSVSYRRRCCLLANLNSLPLDFIARQKVGGLHLNFFIVDQFPVLPPDAYDDRCPWDNKQKLEKWVSDRVLKLTCTADDMRGLAGAALFKEGVHKWKEAERAELRAELDAAYFHLYGINRDDAEYILSTFQGMTDGDDGSFTPNSAASRVMEAYDKLAAS